MTASPLFEILDHRETPLGLLCLRRRELLSRPGAIVTEVTLNHEFLMSSYNTASERALAEYALARHPGSHLRVLVGGLGLGYTAHEALKSSAVAHVEVVELLSAVTSWLKQGLLPLSEDLNGDPRLEVVEGDAYARLQGPPTSTHDVIMIDVDHNPQEPLVEGNLPFYMNAGLEATRAHLAPGGVLAVWSSEDDPAFVTALNQVFSDVTAEPVEWFNELIDEEQTDYIFLARRAD